MSFWTHLRVPAQHDMVIGVYDCQWLARHAEKAASLSEVIDVMTGFFAITGPLVHAAGGRLVKTLADCGLTAFPPDHADAAVLALREIQRVGEAWLAERGYRTRILVKADRGPVVFGMVGTPGAETLEVYGRPVATAHTLPSTGFSMTAPVFRSLEAGTRALFKKHTPPIRYIAADDSHSRTS